MFRRALRLWTVGSESQCNFFAANLAGRNRKNVVAIAADPAGFSFSYAIASGLVPKSEVFDKVKNWQGFWCKLEAQWAERQGVNVNTSRWNSAHTDAASNISTVKGIMDYLNAKADMAATTHAEASLALPRPSTPAASDARVTSPPWS